MIELLSPAGSMECLKAAAMNGCDAVYIGGKDFSARQYAGNFSLEEIKEACDYCHLRGIKLYAAVNTLYKDEEIFPLLKYVGELYEMGADALILQDLGAAAAIKKAFSDIPLHASTQLTAMSLPDVIFLRDMGFSRVILSRELSLPEIEKISKEAGCETEVFIHGALCFSYSGQCLMSSMLGGRSGNRGRCAQPCRLFYTIYKGYDKGAEGYLLSPKDISALRLLPEIKKAGVAAVKIEGRMKSPQYVAGATAIYRKYIDLLESGGEFIVDDRDTKTLMQLFNRGGFSEGYFSGKAGSAMISAVRPKSWGVLAGHVDAYNPKAGRVTVRTREPFVPGDGIEIWTKNEPHPGCNITKQSRPGEVINFALQGEIEKNQPVYKTYDKRLSDALAKTWEKDSRKLEITASADTFIGRKISLTLDDGRGTKVTVFGDVVGKAENKPVSREKTAEQLTKMGSTSFVVKDIKINSDENIYIGISSLNEARRNASEALTEALVQKHGRKPADFQVPIANRAGIRKNKRINVQVLTRAQFDAALEFDEVNIIYLEPVPELLTEIQILADKCKKRDVKLFAALPHIDSEENRDIYETLENSGVQGFLIRTAGRFPLFKKTGKETAADISLNIFNRESVKFWEGMGADIVALSPEMNVREIKSAGDARCETVVYGRLPLMLTRQCLAGNFDGGREDGVFCKNKGTGEEFFIKDRKGVKFPIIRDCKSCTALILNEKPISTLKFFDEILETPTGHMRLIFTNEGFIKTRNILTAYIEAANGIQGEASKRLIKEMGENESTKGHYFRGVL